MNSALSLVEREYQFGPFRFVPARQWLAYGDTPVRVGGRALDLLSILIERPGEVISKRELMARAWPRCVVEDSNLKVQLSALRRALARGEQGDGYVVTVTGRGYRFVAPVSQGVSAGSAPLPPAGGAAIGREDAVAALAAQLAQRRIVTLVGAAGIGKSTVALEVAGSLAQQGGRVCSVDLTTLAGAHGAGDAVAAALRGAPHDGRTLLLLDGCEHVLDEVAMLVAPLAAQAGGITILATSREPLRVPGEYVHRLDALDYPRETAPSASQALAYGAVRLFVARAAQCLGEFCLGDDDAAAVVEICRRLEGIPLAIELAATRMDALGARELAARLDERFRLLARGRRTLAARHRTLTAALDWSYARLPDAERRILLGVAGFPDAFTLDDALALLTAAGMEAGQVVDGVANLVEQSLLCAAVGGATVHYRLLNMTRAWALDKCEAQDLSLAGPRRLRGAGAAAPQNRVRTYR